MTAYFVFNYTVKDPDLYTQYREKVGLTLGQYGGKPIVASHDNETIEGEPQPILIVLEFESKQAARTWYDSEAYQGIIDLRKDACSDGWSVIVDQFSP